MPGSRREVGHAEEEGVHFEWLSLPKAIHGDADRVDAVRATRMRLSAPDLSGRRSVEMAPDAEFDMPAQLVIEALGFDAEDLPTLFGAPELRLSRHGTIAVDMDQQTSLAGVFAAGDIVRGASLVVWAVRDGQDAALGIDKRLKAQALAAEPQLESAA